MSDLAPFVAATLRDKVLSELLEENRKLREEKHSLEYVEITGPNREPVYARGHLRDDGREQSIEDPLTGHWRVDLDAEQRLPCSLQELGSLEVWIGRARVKGVSKLDAGLHIREGGPDGVVTLGITCVIRTRFGLNQEERLNVRARAAEAAEANGDRLSLDLEMLRFVTEQVTDPTKSCTFVSIYLHPKAVHLL